MSFDELPPDAEPSHVEDAVSPVQDPSVTDAPPAALTASVGAEDPGTDAASPTANAKPAASVPTSSMARADTGDMTSAIQEETALEKPASRASRRRVSRTEETAAPMPEETTPPPAPRARSTRRRSKPEIVPEAVSSEAPPAPVSEAVSEPEPATETPPARRSRSTRKAVTPPVVETEAAPPVPVADAPRSTRRRTSRKPTESIVEQGREPTESTAPLPAETTAEREIAAAALSETDADTEATAVGAEIAAFEPTAGAAAEPAQPARRRASRSRRKPAVDAPEETIPERAAAPPIADAVVSKSTEQEETSEEGADEKAATSVEDAARPASERRKRNRRGGRGRRGDTLRRDVQPEPSALIETELTDDKAALLPPVPVSPPAASVQARVIDITVGAHLVSRNDRLTLQIDGRAYPSVLFFGNMEGGKNAQRVLSEVRHAARAGVHLHSTLIELPCPLSEAGHALDEIDVRLRALLDADPDGFVMPRVVFLPARGWKREYPTEISSYSGGASGDPSLTSFRFWQECERSLETLIHHLQDQVWGHRVFGYHLERGEWFQPEDLGFDRSMANRDAFRDWLREKYDQNLVSLRAAWYDGDVQFHTAEIPPVPTKPNLQRAFFDTRRERCLIDFNEFTSESTANRLISLARVVKQAAGHKALVSVCYGYTLEFGHGFSGHLALDRLLAEPSIDLICGPPSYRDRKPGGAASFPSPADTPALYGKLWLSEDDTKTYLAPVQQDPEDFNPRLSDRFQTEQAQVRAMGKALVHGTAVNWMDLWGEGWLDEEATWERIRTFTQLLSAREGTHTTPEVVALIDEKSLLHIQRGEPFFRRLSNGLRDTLQRAGVSYGLYLQSDLTSSHFPTGAKLYLFLTPFRLTAVQREAIKDKLQGSRRTLAWLYAPGACDERPSIPAVMEEAATGTIGITLRQQPWNSEIGSRLTETGHVVTERIPGREFGVRERLNPSFYVDDPGAAILGEYHGSGLPSLAVKDLGTWRSVFVGEPVLPLELLRGICRYAGVHLWTEGGDDVIDVGAGWVMIHGNRDGQRVLKLPARSALYDLTEQRLAMTDAFEYRFFLKAGATRLFYCGKIEQMARMKLPNLEVAARPPRTPLSSPGPIVRPLTESVPDALSIENNPDLETLRAVLSMEMPESLDLEETADEAIELRYTSTPRPNPPLSLEEALGGETIGGRRRRRRGGRGRGRRRPGEEENEEGQSADSAAPLLPPAEMTIPRLTGMGQADIKPAQRETDETYREFRPESPVPLRSDDLYSMEAPREGAAPPTFHEIEFDLVEPAGHDDFHDPAPMGALPEPEAPDWAE